jgi:hypothetical protein
MTEQKQRVEFIEEKPEKQEKPQGKKAMGLKDFLTGSVLTKEGVSTQLPYILFMAFIAVFYIGNRYRYEKLVIKEQKLKTEVRNLRAESITTAAQLMFISKQTEVARLVESKGLGLKESVVPPKKIK